MFALRHWVTSGLLAQAMADRQVKALRRAMRVKNPWMRKDWKHDEERQNAAALKRARRLNGKP